MPGIVVGVLVGRFWAIPLGAVAWATLLLADVVAAFTPDAQAWVRLIGPLAGRLCRDPQAQSYEHDAGRGFERPAYPSAPQGSLYASEHARVERKP